MNCACGHGETMHPGLEGCVRVGCECTDFRLAAATTRIYSGPDGNRNLVGEFVRSDFDSLVILDPSESPLMAALRDCPRVPARLDWLADDLVPADDAIAPPIAMEPESDPIGLKWYEEFILWLCFFTLAGLSLCALFP